MQPDKLETLDDLLAQAEKGSVRSIYTILAMRWTAIDSERFNPGTPTSKAGSLAIASATAGPSQPREIFIWFFHRKSPGQPS